MAILVQEINLEVSKPNRFQAIVAKQYDSDSRFLKVTLVNCGEKIEIKQTSTTVINANRIDGECQSYFGVTNDDGTATVPLNSWMLELEGNLICDVSIIDADDRKLTSTSFTVLVEKSASGDVSPDVEHGIFHSLIESANGANEAAQIANAAAQSANKAAEEANKAAEYANDSNTSVVIVEQNKDNHFMVWIGTTEEYDAQKDSITKDTMCIITDDPNDDIIKHLITNTGRTALLNGGDLNDFIYCCRLNCIGAGSGVVLKNSPTTSPFTMDVVSATGIHTELVDGQPYEYLLQKITTFDGKEFFRSVYSNGEGTISFGNWRKNAQNHEVMEIIDLGSAPFQCDPKEFSSFILEFTDSVGASRKIQYTDVVLNTGTSEVIAKAFQFNDEGDMYRYHLRFYPENGKYAVESILTSYSTSTSQKASSAMPYNHIYGIKIPF